MSYFVRMISYNRAGAPSMTTVGVGPFRTPEAAVSWCERDTERFLGSCLLGEDMTRKYLIQTRSGEIIQTVKRDGLRRINE